MKILANFIVRSCWLSLLLLLQVIQTAPVNQEIEAAPDHPIETFYSFDSQPDISVIPEAPPKKPWYRKNPFASIVALSPNDRTGTSSQDSSEDGTSTTAATCCICSEPMNEKRRSQKRCMHLKCGHDLCRGCGAEMVATASKVPLQLVSCPLCRDPIDQPMIHKMTRGNFWTRYKYVKWVMYHLPVHIKASPGDTAAIQEAMKKDYFAPCHHCKKHVTSIPKSCAEDEPISEKFECEKCTYGTIATCPNCKQGAHRASGCKFMYCRCGVNFCFLCEKRLTENEHYSHFRGPRGPFGNSCKGK